MSEGGSIRADKAPQSSRSGVLVPPTLRESQASIRQGEGKGFGQGEAMPHGRHVSVCMCSALEMEVQLANHAQGIRWSLKI